MEPIVGRREGVSAKREARERAFRGGVQGGQKRRGELFRARLSALLGEPSVAIRSRRGRARGRPEPEPSPPSASP
jgi:hypothetical protein